MTDACGGRSRYRHHVGLVDAHPAANRRAVESEALLEGLFIQRLRSRGHFAEVEEYFDGDPGMQQAIGPRAVKREVSNRMGDFNAIIDNPPAPKLDPLMRLVRDKATPAELRGGIVSFDRRRSDESEGSGALGEWAARWIEAGIRRVASGIALMLSDCTAEKQAEQIIAAANAGKHLIIEKPITLNLADAKRVMAAMRSPEHGGRGDTESSGSGRDGP